VQFKMEQALGFLTKGHRVRLLVAFPGAHGARQAALQQAARLQGLAADRGALAQPPPPGSRSPKNALLLELSAAAEAQ
jgi:translation initiation factor IF-3